jgi:hypothetical protein
MMLGEGELESRLEQLELALQSFNMAAIEQFSALKTMLTQLNPELVTQLEGALEQLNFALALLYTEQYQAQLKGLSDES